MPTTLALINPKFGSFNVTAKGGMVQHEYFDWKIALPYVVILVLNIVGFGFGMVRLFWWNSFEAGTVFFNIAWTVYNFMLLGAALAVALETRQVRRNWRVQRVIPAMVKLPTGRTIVCQTEDFSEGGLALNLPAAVTVDKGSTVTISLFRGEREFTLPALVVYNQGTVLRLRFEDMSLDNYRALVAATFSRSDAWQKWLPEGETDHPLHGLQEVFVFSLEGIRRIIKSVIEAAPWRRWIK